MSLLFTPGSVAVTISSEVQALHWSGPDRPHPRCCGILFSSTSMSLQMYPKVLPPARSAGSAPRNLAVPGNLLPRRRVSANLPAPFSEDCQKEKFAQVGLAWLMSPSCARFLFPSYSRCLGAHTINERRKKDETCPRHMRGPIQHTEVSHLFRERYADSLRMSAHLARAYHGHSLFLAQEKQICAPLPQLCHFRAFPSKDVRSATTGPQCHVILLKQHCHFVVQVSF